MGHRCRKPGPPDRNDGPSMRLAPGPVPVPGPASGSMSALPGLPDCRGTKTRDLRLARQR
jgi:hypothetical protein